MDWRAFVQTRVPHHRCAPGAAWAELVLAEERLGVSLAADLRSLLLQTNGVIGAYEIPLIWPLDRIVAENLRIKADDELRARCMPLDCLLFFADAGNGDLFAYAMVNSEIRRGDIFTWSHEDDSRYVVAPSLVAFMEGWTKGTITL